MNNYLDHLFQTLESRYFKYSFHIYNNLVEKATDKEYAKVLNYVGHAFMHDIILKANPFNKDLIQAFNHIHKLGYPVSQIFDGLDALRERHHKLEEAKNEERLASRKVNYEYNSLLDKIRSRPSQVTIQDEEPESDYVWASEVMTDSDPEKVIRFLIKYWANEKLTSYLKLELGDMTDEEMQTILERSLPPETIKTFKDKFPKESGSKQKVIRKKDDQLTTLSLEQTATLAYLFRQTNIFLAPEHLPNRLLADAFQLLTGYSPNTLRVNIGNTRPPKATWKKIKEVLIMLLEQVETEIKSAK